MDISGPKLIIDKAKVLRNIDRIAKKSVRDGFSLVPHFKTHQSLEIGGWFRDFGVEEITVSSVAMAEYFADAPSGAWKSIYIAFPLIINELEKIGFLANKVDLCVLVNEEAQAKELIEKVTNPVRVKLEVDCGSHRSGINPKDHRRISKLAEIIQNSQHSLDGLYSHFGHTYSATNVTEVREVYYGSIELLRTINSAVFKDNIDISLGDTPSASTITFEGIKSVHAGNYVFYDLTQAAIGVCNEEDIAIVLAAPIVSKNPSRNELVIHGGGIHLSKENLYSVELERAVYGKIVELTYDGWTGSLNNCYLTSLSQEHGVVKVSDEAYDSLNVGDVIGVLPVHSCMTADCMRGYHSIDGNIIDHLKGLPYN